MCLGSSLCEMWVAILTETILLYRAQQEEKSIEGLVWIRNNRYCHNRKCCIYFKNGRAIFYFLCFYLPLDNLFLEITSDCIIVHLKRNIFIAYTVGVLSGIGVTAGAHRLWTHRTYKAKLPLRILLMAMFLISGQVRK